MLIWYNFKKTLPFRFVFKYFKTNSFELFGMMRKLGILYPVEGFFKLHSGLRKEKRRKMGTERQFFSHLKKFK